MVAPVLMVTFEIAYKCHSQRRSGCGRRKHEQLTLSQDNFDQELSVPRLSFYLVTRHIEETQTGQVGFATHLDKTHMAFNVHE